ncbi:MAG: DUF5777 family beta-barrel protein [Bacteroidota bacterium]
MKPLFAFLLFCTLCLQPTLAQDDLMSLLDDMEEETTDYTYATFKTTRLVNGHSIEMSAPGVLTLIIAHRFGRLNGGFAELFGLDQANMRFGFEYGVTNWLNLGVGRSNVRKTYDGYVKARLLRQSSGKRKFPFSLTALSAMQVNTLPWPDPTRENFYSSRLSFTHQIMIARKFNESLSLQIMPTLVHRNFVASQEEENDVWSIGAGGRIKLSPSVTLNVEYYYLLPGFTADNFEDSFSVGFDIETGGHVFQLIFSNTIAMTENLFIAESTNQWDRGEINFGFNLSRVFTIADNHNREAKKAAKKEGKKKKQKKK